MSETTRTRPSRTSARSQPDLGRWLAVALGVVAVAFVAWFAFTPGTDGEQAGEPVEDFLHVHGIEIPTWAEGEVYVSTHQGVFRIDGDDWTWISEQSHDFMGFAAHPSEQGVLFSSGHPAPDSDLPNPLGLMVSTDHGTTWQPRALRGEVDFHAMSVSAGDGEVIYGYDGRAGLLRSLNGGHTWERLPAEALQQAGGALNLAVGTGDQDEIFVGTDVGLLRSGNAGRSWETLIAAPVSAVSIDVADPERLLAYVADEEQGLALSEDGGQRWRSLDLVLDDDLAGHVAVDPADRDRIWVGTWGQALWRTTDGGQEWEQLAEDGNPIRP